MERIKLKPHLQKIVNYIRKHGSVTVREATLSKELNTVELRKRISEINRAKGYEFIAGTYEPNRDGGQHKRYRLCK